MVNNIKMKKLTIIFCLLSITQLFAQSKKQQIEQLTFKIDSLQIELDKTKNSIAVIKNREINLQSRIDSLYLENHKKSDEIILINKAHELSISGLMKQNESENELKRKEVDKIKVEYENLNKELKIKEHTIQLTNLVWKANDWYKIHDGDLFKFIEKNNQLRGVDWTHYNFIAQSMKESELFTDKFIASYKAVLEEKNNQIKKIIGGEEIDLIDVYGEVDPFCNCQDDTGLSYELYGVSIINDSAEFFWMLGGDEVDTQKSINGDTDLQWMKYNMEAKFLNGKWKIDKMDGFASE
jgi:hypothetical protein